MKSKKWWSRGGCTVLWIGLCLGGLRAAPEARGGAGERHPLVIVFSEGASPLEELAAREIQRYLYLRTGELCPVLPPQRELPPGVSSIAVATKDKVLAKAMAATPEPGLAVSNLPAQAYLLRTAEHDRQQAILILGGDDTGTLYGAYRFAEHLGVRFFLHGDVIPDERASLWWRRPGGQKGAERLRFDRDDAFQLKLPKLDERAAPLFGLRGIQPFHDFPEGPDWWDTDDYLAVISQLPKLRMNFIGLHTYPEAKPCAEPTVWIGVPGDIDGDRAVKFSYPASYQNTLRGNWGYTAKKTSEFVFGAASLFERDDYGCEVMRDLCPEPQTPEARNDVFQRAARLLGDAFQHARRLGIKTCVGTETPLTVPKAVAERLQASGRDPKSLEVLQELYEGIFRRVARAYPLDYYWFWTPEGWTWEGTKPEEIMATTNDLFAAMTAAKKAGAPFQLATCGWVLGPQTDRALFSKVLPADVALSCINRQVGKEPVDAGFAQVQGRGKWAIPWLEDDPALTSPQLWVGRMRRDAADAHRYGCDGLMGIHWRTRILGPAVLALAQAAWDQTRWNTPALAPAKPARQAGPVGGKLARFDSHAIADTEDDVLYQTVRYDVSAYHLPLLDPRCRVTLKFCEPHYTQAGKRVFDVKLQGQTVLEELDIFARVGQDRALDFSFDDVKVTNGWVEVQFVKRVEYPCIAAIVVQTSSTNYNINCGGPAYQNYLADEKASAEPEYVYPPVDDFYLDWAVQEFGPAPGPKIAPILARVDGRLPRPSDWVGGPGGIKPDPRPWAEVEPEYRFVAELAALQSEVHGRGHVERYHYWLDTFGYMKAMARVNCLWAQYNVAVAKAKEEEDPAQRKKLARDQALPVRRQLVSAVAEVYRYLLRTVSNPGELGTVANWEQHLLPDVLTQPGQELAALLEEDLPPDAQPGKNYEGPTRLIVPTQRSCFLPGETLGLKVIVLSPQPPRQAMLHWRAMGRGDFAGVALSRVARGVHAARFPAEATRGGAIEYYLKVVPETGRPVVFPASAPRINQTLVAMPRTGPDR